MFKNYPKTRYSIVPGEFRLIVDRYFKVDFFDEYLKNNIQFFKDTIIQDNETPESMSSRVYHNKKFYFLILLINGIYDPYFDWVLSNDELLLYAKKYVTENFIEVKEYLAQNSSILENLSETLGRSITLNTITPVLLNDPDNIITEHLIDHYFTKLVIENDKKRHIYLPEAVVMNRIYNDFLMITNNFE